MQFYSEMLKTHPRGMQIQNLDMIAECIRACFECAQACTECADACLAEANVKNLVRCIRLNQDCADICDATGRVLSRQTEPAIEVFRSQLQSCITACNSCASECEIHAGHHEHCRICALACRMCEDSCNKLLKSMRQ